MNALIKAIESKGGLKSLADAIGASPQQVHNWSLRRVPVDRCIQIEEATDGAVRVEDLRPDVPWHVIRGRAA